MENIYVTYNSDAYVINGAPNNPTIYFVRGNSYNIYVNAPGHPFYIQTVSGGYSVNDIYTTGVTNNGTATETIRVNVPLNAPQQLYYVCQNHSYMAGSIIVS